MTHRRPLARSLAAVHEQRRALEAQINALLEAHPLSPVLTSMPGVGVRTAAVLLVTVGDGTNFPSAAHMASYYAGLAPTTKSSGTSIHGEHAPRGGNRQLKRAMFLSALACMNADPASRTYYDKHAPAAKPTPRPSSASPANASASCSPCSETEPSTNPAHPRTSSSPHEPSKTEAPQTRQGSLTKDIEAPPPADHPEAVTPLGRERVREVEAAAFLRDEGRGSEAVAAPLVPPDGVLDVMGRPRRLVARTAERAPRSRHCWPRGSPWRRSAGHCGSTTPPSAASPEPAAWRNVSLDIGGRCHLG